MNLKDQSTQELCVILEAILEELRGRSIQPTLTMTHLLLTPGVGKVTANYVAETLTSRGIKVSGFTPV